MTVVLGKEAEESEQKCTDHLRTQGYKERKEPDFYQAEST